LRSWISAKHCWSEVSPIANAGDEEATSADIANAITTRTVVLAFLMGFT